MSSMFTRDPAHDPALAKIRQDALANVARAQQATAASDLAQAIAQAQESAAAAQAEERQAAGAAEQQRAAEWRAANEVRLKDQERRAFLASGAATEADFEAAWAGGLRLQTLAHAGPAAHAAAQASQASIYRNW